VEKSLKVDIRRHGPLARRTGAVTSTDTYERLERPVGRSREFWDAIMRVSATPVAGIPTHMKEQGRWNS
jgi:hypothetical protein